MLFELFLFPIPCLTTQWEHKCLELVAEQQMTFEATVIPKEARIAALERSLAEKIDTSRELRHQKASYVSQLTECNRRVADLEIKLTSTQSSLQEKESVIHMLQKSFLEPEEEGAYSSSPSHHHHKQQTHAPPPPPVLSHQHPSQPVIPPPHHQHAPPPSSTSSNPPSSSLPPPPQHHGHAPYTAHQPLPLPPPPPIYFSASKETVLNGSPECGSATPPHPNRGPYVEMLPYSSPSSIPPPARVMGVATAVAAPPPKSPGVVTVIGTSPAPPTISQPAPGNDSTNYRSQSVSPVKGSGGGVSGGGGSSNHTPKPRSAPAKYSNYHHKRSTSGGTGTKNGYSVHHVPTGGGATPPTGRYAPSHIHRRHGPSSSSAPNSPNVVKASSPRKPRISHPNMRLLRVPSPGGEYSSSGGGGGAPGVGFRQAHAHNNIRWKSNTGPGATRRPNYKPLPSPREVKSKTPPPDYRLVSVSGASRGGSGNCKPDPPKILPRKQRHRSVEDILEGSGRHCQQDTPPIGQAYSPGSLELFQSLIGQSGGGGGKVGGNRHETQPHHNPLLSSLQVMGGAGGMARDHYGLHQHSKSSPTNDHKVLP